MKKSHYLRLLAYEPFILLSILFYGGWIAWTNISHFHEVETGYLGFLPDLIFAFSLTGLSLTLVFKTLGTGMKSRSGVNAMAQDMEFFFSRAVSRRTLFYARSSRFLLACLFPVLLTWAFSYGRPLIKMRISYVEKQREPMEQYYLAHYPDAFLLREPVDKDGNETVYAVLPRGQVSRAFFAVAFVCFTALLYQFATFIFWGNRWAVIAVFLGFIFLPVSSIFWLVQSHIYSIDDVFAPSLYETGLAWVTQHTPLTLLILGVLTIVTQTYSCRRYINTEITS